MTDPSLMDLPFYADMAYTGVLPTMHEAHVHERPPTTSNRPIQAGAVPLICYVCPQNTKFSDISHMLTHVSSKGHLARLYNLEIVSQTSAEAAGKVERFKIWKDTYKIDQLVLQRMEARGGRGIQPQPSRGQNSASTRARAKNQRGSTRADNTNSENISENTRGSGTRGGNTRGGSTRGGSTRGGSARGSSTRGGGTHSSPGNRGGSNTIGGRASRITRASTSSRAQTQRPIDDAGIKGDPENNDEEVQNHHDEISLRSWGSAPNPLMIAGHQADLDDMSYEDVSKYEPSEGGSSFPSEPLDEVNDREVDDGDVDDGGVDNGDVDNGEVIDREARTAALILKGATYPGMGLFDSASEDQRRRRNQRKSPAIHRQLVKNSKSVTTTEEVFDSEFSFQRTRDVYDDASVHESEDEEQEQHVDKRRKRRSQNRTATKKTARHSTPSRDRQSSSRATRGSVQPPRSLPVSRRQNSSPKGRKIRSIVHRNAMTQSLHNHGFQEEAGMFQESMGGQNDLGRTPPLQPFNSFESCESSESSSTPQSSGSLQCYGSSPSLDYSPLLYQRTQSFQPDQSFQPMQSFHPAQSYQSAPSYQSSPSYPSTSSYQSTPSYQLVQSSPHLHPFQEPFQSIRPHPFAGNIPADTEEQILPMGLLGDGGRSESASIRNQLIYQWLTNGNSPDRLPGLALRPGNPNLSFASPSPGLKRTPTPTLFAGKENNNLTLKTTTASSNPYLQSTDSIQGESYNPLYVENQARDGLGFRSYSSYNEDVKSATTGFQPINGRGTGDFDSLQIPPHNNEEAELWDIPEERGQHTSSHHGASYHSTQANDESFDF